MQIRMDTDAVRAMSSRLRQTADSMDTRLASIKSAVESAGWQSQAREEFIMQLEMLKRSAAQSSEVMRLMARASDRKADQWEAIANVFNGPFYYLEGIWDSVVGFISGIGNKISSAISNINWPSLPQFLRGWGIGVGATSFSPSLVVGAIPLITPNWIGDIIAKWRESDWWPFNKPNSSTNEENKESENEEGKQEEGSSSSNDLDNLKEGEYLKTELNIDPNPRDYGKSTWKRHCGGYVQAVVGIDNIGKCRSACDWIEINSLEPHSSAKDLRMQLEPGDVVVWPKTGEGNKGHQGANNVHGHAAVITKVYEDHVVLAESSWGKSGSPNIGRTLDKSQLDDGLYVWSNPEIQQEQIQVENGS